MDLYITQRPRRTPAPLAVAIIAVLGLLIWAFTANGRAAAYAGDSQCPSENVCKLDNVYAAAVDDEDENDFDADDTGDDTDTTGDGTTAGTTDTGGGTTGDGTTAATTDTGDTTGDTGADTTGDTTGGAGPGAPGAVGPSGPAGPGGEGALGGQGGPGRGAIPDTAMNARSSDLQLPAAALIALAAAVGGSWVRRVARLPISKR